MNIKGFNRVRYDFSNWIGYMRTVALLLMFLAILVNVFIFTVIPALADLSDGLVVYSPFNGDATDGSGNGNDGIATGVVLTSDRFDNINSAYLFDGNDDYIDIPDSPTLDSYDTLSVFCWLKTTTNNGTIITKTTSSESHGFQSGWFFKVADFNVPGELYVSFRLGGGSPSETFYSNVSVNDDEWYHVGFTWNELLGEVKIYVDGDVVFSDNDSLTIASNDAPVTIGWSSTHLYSAGQYEGILDDICIYNRTLSESEVQDLYQIVNPTSEPPIPETTAIVLMFIGLLTIGGYILYNRRLVST